MGAVKKISDKKKEQLVKEAFEKKRKIKILTSELKEIEPEIKDYLASVGGEFSNADGKMTYNFDEKKSISPEEIFDLYKKKKLSKGELMSVLKVSVVDAKKILNEIAYHDILTITVGGTRRLTISPTMQTKATTKKATKSPKVRRKKTV